MKKKGESAMPIREESFRIACGVGIGSGVVKKEAIAQGNFETITALAKEYTDQI